MAKYHSRPVEVDAFRWDGDPVDGFERIAVGLDELGACRFNLIVPTPRGDAFAVEGDWIVRGPRGDLGLCNDETFRADYEPCDPAKED
jgi:hypothetical protein